MNTLKKIIGQIHLWLGLVSGLVVVVVSLTGCMYVFEEEARSVFQHKYFFVENSGTPRQSLYQISAAIKSNYPYEKIEQIRFKSAANTAYLYYTESDKVISINPYTLAIQGVRDLENDFFDFILDIHLHLKLGEVGEHIIKYNVLIFFILCVSGLILWWPKQKRFLKQALSIKFKTTNWKRLNWDIHSVLGFYALGILLIISLTGIFWVFDSAKWLVSKVTGYAITKTKAPEMKSKVIDGKAITLEDAYYDAQKRYLGQTQTVLTLPAKNNQPIRVLFRYPYTVVRKQNTLFYDKNTGALLREDLFKNYNAYDKVMRSNYDFHTGNIKILGIGSKIIYFLASLLAASLPITGFSIWWGRKNKKITNRTPKPVGNHYSSSTST